MVAHGRRDLAARRDSLCSIGRNFGATSNPLVASLSATALGMPPPFLSRPILGAGSPNSPASAYSNRLTSARTFLVTTIA